MEETVSEETGIDFAQG